MGNLKMLFILIVLIAVTNSVLAQKAEIYIVNETNSTFQTFDMKSSSTTNWVAIDLPEESDEYLQAFSIVIYTEENCLLDFKANDGLVEYKWLRVDVCNAVEVSLFVEDDGTPSYIVTYTELEDENEEGME